MRFRIAITACSAMVTGVAAALIVTQRTAEAMPVQPGNWECSIQPAGCVSGSTTCCYIGTWEGGECNPDSMEVSDCCLMVSC